MVYCSSRKEIDGALFSLHKQWRKEKSEEWAAVELSSSAWLAW